MTSATDTTIRPMGIGQIGLGSITTNHRDGYRRFGLPVVAGFDIAASSRERLAAEEPGARVYDSLDALLEDPRVEVIDLATPHFAEARLPAVEGICRVRKPVLIQKPLSFDYETAAQIVDLLRSADVPVMINQNMCFTAGVADAARTLLEQDAFGKPFMVRANWNWPMDCSEEHWFGKERRWWTTDLTVHSLSVLHLLFGPPETVYCVQGRDPDQPGVRYEGFSHLLLRYPSSLYPDGMCATVYSSGTHYGQPDGVAPFTIQGPGGIVTLRNGQSTTLSSRAARAAASEPERHVVTTHPDKWFPNAFGRTMAHFQAALQAGKTPLCSGADNLYVMAVVEAAYRSQEENRVVLVAEIMANRHDPAYGPGWWHGYNAWHSPKPIDNVPAFGYIG